MSFELKYVEYEDTNQFISIIDWFDTLEDVSNYLTNIVIGNGL